MLLSTAIITTLTLRRQILLRQSLGRSGGLDQRPPAGRRRGGQAGQEEPVRGVRVAALDERRLPHRTGRLRVEGEELQVQQEVDLRIGQDEGPLHRRKEVRRVRGLDRGRINGVEIHNLSNAQDQGRLAVG